MLIHLHGQPHQCLGVCFIYVFYLKILALITTNSYSVSSLNLKSQTIPYYWRVVANNTFYATSSASARKFYCMLLFALLYDLEDCYSTFPYSPQLNLPNPGSQFVNNNNITLSWVIKSILYFNLLQYTPTSWGLMCTNSTKQFIIKLDGVSIATVSSTVLYYTASNLKSGLHNWTITVSYFIKLP